ncbi:MAG TPA: hypothetical protein VHH34_14770 [Pseudonocardiaceae bacterium]|nr:hypothetical protein [Pseudonocardiaceae bacterium]
MLQILLAAFFLAAAAGPTQVFVLDSPVLAITPAVLGVLLALIAWYRRPQTGRQAGTSRP